MDERSRYLERLRKLMHMHCVSVDGDGPNPGFIEDEMVTRNSYRMVLEAALESGVLTDTDLKNEGLPEYLDQLK